MQPSKDAECVACGETTSTTCDMCDDEVCDDCLGEHFEEYHGFGSEDL